MQTHLDGVLQPRATNLRTAELYDGLSRYRLHPPAVIRAAKARNIPNSQRVHSFSTGYGMNNDVL